MKKILLVAASILFLVASCTVEKRVYRNGFNVQWHAMNGHSKKDKNVTSETIMDEMAESNTILTPKTSVKTAEVYAIPVQEVSMANATDVASISEAPVLLENKTTLNTFKGMASETIANQQLSKQGVKVSKQELKALKKAVKSQTKNDDIPVAVLYILCFCIPFVAVGLVTDWDTNQVLVNFILTLLCGIPGIIHAFIVVSKNV